MWEITSPEIRRVERTFEDGRNDYMALYDGRTELVTDIDHLSGRPFPRPVMFTGYQNWDCADGWIDLRRSNDLVLLCPAFELMFSELARSADNPPHETTAYGPPWYFKRHGVPFVHKDRYCSLRRTAEMFPEFEAIPLISVREAVYLYQFETPSRLLGFGETPTVREEGRDRLSFASEGDQYKHIITIIELLQECAESPDVSLIPVQDKDRLITIYLGPSPQEWHCLTFDGQEYLLHLSPGLSIVCRASRRDVVDLPALS